MNETHPLSEFPKLPCDPILTDKAWYFGFPQDEILKVRDAPPGAVKCLRFWTHDCAGTTSGQTTTVELRIMWDDGPSWERVCGPCLGQVPDLKAWLVNQPSDPEARAMLHRHIDRELAQSGLVSA